MLYNLPAITNALRATALKPAQGQDKLLYVSTEAATKVAEMTFPTDNTSAYTVEANAFLTQAGVDLQAIVKLRWNGSATLVGTVTGTATDGTALTGTFTLTPPTYARNQANSYEESIAVDVIASGGKQWAVVNNYVALSGVSSTTGLQGSAVELYVLPSSASWGAIGTVEDMTLMLGTRPPHAVPDGADGSKFVVPGRSKPREVKVRTKHVSVADGLMRVAGVNCCLRLDINKGGLIVTDRYVATNCILEVNPDFPDENDIKDAADGISEKVASFYAV